MIKTTFGDGFLSRLTARVNDAFKGGRGSRLLRRKFRLSRSARPSRSDDVATKKNVEKASVAFCFV